jgi:hypothetical protein
MLHWNPTDATLSFDTRLSPSTPEARDLVRRARQRPTAPAFNRRGRTGGGAHRHPSDPRRSTVSHRPRTSGYYIAITHSGVTMSPFLGAVVADDVAFHVRSRISDRRVSSTDLGLQTGLGLSAARMKGRSQGVSYGETADRCKKSKASQQLWAARPCRSLHHALSVARTAAGGSAELDPAARRDFRFVGFRVARYYPAGVPGFGSTPSLTSTSCATPNA